MIILAQSLAFCTVFIFLSISILCFIAIFYICKFNYEQIQLERCAVQMRAEEVGRNYPTQEKDIELDLPFYSTSNIPQIMLQNEELPPEYCELESARASPVPSYDEVVYCDQLNRSFQNLLSAR